MSKSPEYRAWRNMRDRCYNPNIHNYFRYGGRGIVVCERWLNSFNDFLSDMGLRPSPNHTIDRFPNNDGNYEPTNCAWRTPKEQANNRSSNTIITHNGISRTISEWAGSFGITNNALYLYLIREPFERAYWFYSLNTEQQEEYLKKARNRLNTKNKKSCA